MSWDDDIPDELGVFGVEYGFETEVLMNNNMLPNSRQLREGHAAEIQKWLKVGQGNQQKNQGASDHGWNHSTYLKAPSLSTVLKRKDDRNEQLRKEREEREEQEQRRRAGLATEPVQVRTSASQLSSGTDGATKGKGKAGARAGGAKARNSSIGKAAGGAESRRGGAGTSPSSLLSAPATIPASKVRTASSMLSGSASLPSPGAAIISAPGGAGAAELTPDDSASQVSGTGGGRGARGAWSTVINGGAGAGVPSKMSPAKSDISRIWKHGEVVPGSVSGKPCSDISTLPLTAKSSFMRARDKMGRPLKILDLVDVLYGYSATREVDCVAT